MADIEVTNGAQGVPITGWCYLCNHAIDGDMHEHMNQDHQATGRKLRTAKISWDHRLANVTKSLVAIANEPDRGKQIEQLDEVLQELYLVRARLAQLKGTPVKRAQEGSVTWE